MHEADDRVLAIMLKAPRPGKVKTRLGSAYAPDAILALYRAFVDDTIELARALRLKTVAMCPADEAEEVRDWLARDVDVIPQRGIGLAAGLRSTFELLCTTARRRVIAFNADSPHLPKGVLPDAYAALATHDLVVGPCDDGGYYLIGAKQPHPGLFDAATMGRESACAALLARVERHRLRVALVAEHYDIDLPEDVVRLAAELGREPSRASRTAQILTAWGLIDWGGA
jgi:uncharacterized protein